MDQTNPQLEAGTQEAEGNSVAKLGLLNEGSLSDFLKSNFLDEKEDVSPPEEKVVPEEPQEPEEQAEVEPEEQEPQAEEESSEQEAESSLSKGVQKRINKLVAAKKAAQSELEAQKAKLEELQRELESVKASPVAKTPAISDFAESLTTPERVQEEYNKALEVIIWCEENPDGSVVTLSDGTEQEISAEKVRAMKVQAMKRRDVELPQRFQYLQQQAAVDKDIANDFPWWAKPESEEYQVAQQVIREFPELKRKRADWKHVAGLVVLGLKAYTEAKNNKAAKQPIKRAPAQPAIKAPIPSSPAQGNVAKARKELSVNPSDQRGVSELVKAMGLV